MLSHLALTAALAALVTYTTAAPVNVLNARNDAPATPTAITSQPILWRSDSGEEICLQVDGGVLQNGQGVGAGPCSAAASVFQSWVYTLGATTIQVAPNNLTETPFCLDFGENLGADGQDLKIWQCYQGLAQQNLFITEDNHIAVENGPGQCVDIRAESVSDDSGPYPITKTAQTFQCTAGNTNQIFIFNQTPTPPGPTPPGPTPPVTEGQNITWVSDSGEEICLQVNNGVFENGQSVGVGPCSAEASVFQSWIYTPGATAIQVAPNNLTETPFCLDFGENLGTNGQAMKIWQCYQGAPQQSLFITEDNHIAVENGPGQCVDIRAESTSDDSGPYPITKFAQTYQCTAGNTNQIFVFT